MPIPQNYQLPTKKRGNFSPLPQGAYNVEITDIELKENQPVWNKPNETADKFNFEFTVLDDKKMEVRDDAGQISIGTTKGRKLWKLISTTMNAGWDKGQPSWLYRIFCAAYNVYLDNKETGSIGPKAINGLVGHKLTVIVKQKPDKKDPSIIYNNITEVMPSEENAGVMKNFSQVRQDYNLEDETPAGLEQIPPPTDNQDVNVDDIPF